MGGICSNFLALLSPLFVLALFGNLRGSRKLSSLGLAFSPRFDFQQSNKILGQISQIFAGANSLRPSRGHKITIRTTDQKENLNGIIWGFFEKSRLCSLHSFFWGRGVREGFIHTFRYQFFLAFFKFAGQNFPVFLQGSIPLSPPPLNHLFMGHNLLCVCCLAYNIPPLTPGNRQEGTLTPVHQLGWFLASIKGDDDGWDHKGG